MRRPAAVFPLVASLLIMSIAVPAFAGPSEDAMEAYKRRDYTEAHRLFKQLAEQGNANAQNNLGVIYRDGKGVPQDYVQAHMLFNLAASRYPASEIENRNQASANRDTIASKMTPAQIAEAQKLAREWKPKKER